MKMMYALFHARRVAIFAIKAGAYALLYRFHHGFIFTFNAIRVGEASTLDLALHTLDVTGNVDAPGTITNGIVRLPGADAHIGGNLPSLEISGAATLQRATTASGAVSVTGTLTVHELPLSIAIP